MSHMVVGKLETLTVAVTSGHPGTIGMGAKFSGKALEQGKPIHCVADYKVFGRDARIPLPGDVWSVTGVKVKNKPGRMPPQLFRVSSGELQKLEGDYLVYFLINNIAITAQGIGEGKIHRIVAHFKSLHPGGPQDGDDARNKWWKELIATLDAGNVKPLVGEGLLTTQSATRLLKAWRQSDRAEITLATFLQDKEVPRDVARKIMWLMDDRAIPELLENPYRLLSVLKWDDLDPAARNHFGAAPNDPRRHIAAVLASLNERLTEGHHTLTSHRELRKMVSDKLGVDLASAEDAINMARDCNKDRNGNGLILGDAGKGWQTRGAVWLESSLKNTMLGLHHQRGLTRKELKYLQLPEDEIDRLIRLYEDDVRCRPGMKDFPGLKLEQIDAIKIILRSSVSCLCGGAGVGKTTALDCLLYILRATGQTFHQMALAGRAAKRMYDATKQKATTIEAFIQHLIKGDFENGFGFFPMIVIDEASMIDLFTMDRILTHLPPGAPVRFLFVGDQHQLPPIKGGLVFHKLVQSQTIPHPELRIVSRAKGKTGIPALATMIRNGVAPKRRNMPEFAGKMDGVSFIDCEPDKISQQIQAVLKKLGDVDGTDVQCLAIRNDGNGGVDRINEHLQMEMDKRWREQGLGERPVFDTGWGGLKFCFADPVMYTENDYARAIYNGSLGVVVAVSEDCVTVDFEGREIKLAGDDIGRLTLAFVVTVHKAQGSEFERVIVPIIKSPLLDRSMIYTAVTRASKQVVIIGTWSSFVKAITGPTRSDLCEVGLNFD